MSLVYRNENNLMVHSARNILEVNDINCYLKNEHGNTMGIEFGLSNLLELWVSDIKDYDKAMLLIKNEVENPTEKPAWNCSGCQEENEGSFEICWSCQSSKEN
jgi:hypothetical protein